METKYGLDINLSYSVKGCVREWAYKYVFSSAMGINRLVYLERNVHIIIQA